MLYKSIVIKSPPRVKAIFDKSLGFVKKRGGLNNQSANTGLWDKDMSRSSLGRPIG